MAELPFMPIATDALLSDAGDLPNELFGAYCRLLFRWWREGAMPEESETKLARWARVTPEQFQELTEFLMRTHCGWMQKRLFLTYAQQMEKSLKAQHSANVRHGRADAPEIVCERIRNAYADRMLTMNHEPILKARVRAQRENGEKEKGSRRKVSHETKPLTRADLPNADDPELAERWDVLIKAVGAPRAASYLVIDGRPALEKNCTGFVLRASSGIRADKIENEMRGAIDSALGKGQWRVEVGQ